jgi:Ca2+-binding RTX toxin-like protein
MATLTIPGTSPHIDFSGQPLTNIDRIVFPSNRTVEATFEAAQFGPGRIADDVTIVGNGDTQFIVVNLGTVGSFSAAAWRLVDWQAGLGRISIIGTTAAETIVGSSGDDSISGDGQAFAGGPNILKGGRGNDVYFHCKAGDTVVELPGQGRELVYAYTDFVLPENVEDLLLETGDDLSGFGNAGNNHIRGGFGDNLLDGRGGVDLLEGGPGSDTYIIREPRSSGTRVREYFESGTDQINTYVTYTIPERVENLLMLGTGNINAAGSSARNVMTGNSGNNVLDGKAGNDTMNGGAGNDTFVVREAGDRVNENPGEGTDQTNTFVTCTLSANVENLRLLGTDNVDGTGNELNNTLRGNSGNNVLDGRGGGDYMIGAGGDDVFFVDDPGDVIVESAGGGIDQINTFMTEGLDSNVENLLLLGTANITGFGNALGNQITGNSGGNWLLGLLGNDTLTGGEGQDWFVFNTAPGAGNVDTIVDYSLVEDLIGLDDAVFGDAGPVGFLAADAFQVGTAAADASDRIIYDAATGALLYDPDGDGAAPAEQFASVAAGLGLTNGDFYVI